MSAWSWQLLRAGGFRLDGGSMFGVVPKVLWTRLTEPDQRNRIPLQTNCLLLRREQETVLVETGYGGKWTDKDRDIFALESRTIVDALHEVEVDPMQVTSVIVTHLHFDHAGGLTHLDADGNAVSTFPNASIHVQATEWEDAIANKSTMTKTYLRSHLDPVAEQIEPVDGAVEILEGVHVWPMPGHTWGQQAVRFRDPRGTVVYAGDVMPTIHHVGAAFSMGYDMLPYENMRSKLALLSRAAAESWRLVLDHEPGDPVVRIERDAAHADRFTLVPTGETQG